MAFLYEWRKGKMCDKIDCRNPLLYSKEDYNNLEKVIKEEYLAEDKDILMFVAGEHVQKDIAGEKNHGKVNWKKRDIRWYAVRKDWESLEGYKNSL